VSASSHAGSRNELGASQHWIPRRSILFLALPAGARRCVGSACPARGRSHTQPLARPPARAGDVLGWCAGLLRDLSQPKLVGDDARVGVEVVVPHPSGDEVNAFQVDERKPGGPGDELAVDPRPAACGRPRIR
jgi:hypothetical protein